MAKIFERNWVKWVAGVVAPILAVVFDPCLFKGGIAGEPEFLDMRPFAYAMIFGGALAMSLRLLSRWGGSFAAGMLTSFCILSLCLGVCLLPLSLVGMVIAGIGLLGLLPFATSIVFCLEASACFAPLKSWPRAWAGALTVVLLLAAFQIGSMTAMRRAIQNMEAAPRVSSLTRITAWATTPLGFRLQCVRHGMMSTGPARANLAEGYEKVFGANLESEIGVLMD